MGACKPYSDATHRFLPSSEFVSGFHQVFWSLVRLLGIDQTNTATNKAKLPPSALCRPRILATAAYGGSGASPVVKSVKLLCHGQVACFFFWVTNPLWKSGDYMGLPFVIFLWPDTYSTQYEKYQCYSFFTNTHNPTRFHQTSSPSCCSIFPFNPFLLDKHSLNPGKLQRLLFVDVFFHGRVHLRRKNLHFSPRQMVDWFHASTHWFGAKYLVHSLIYGLNSKYLYNMEYNMGIILIHSIHNWWFKYCNVYIYIYIYKYLSILFENVVPDET